MFFKVNHLIPAHAEYPMEVAETDASSAASITAAEKRNPATLLSLAPLISIGAELIGSLLADQITPIDSLRMVTAAACRRSLPCFFKLAYTIPYQSPNYPIKNNSLLENSKNFSSGIGG